MSFADYQALLDHRDRAPMAWSPRECVWLMMLARDRGSDQLVAKLRDILHEQECLLSEA